MAHTLSVSATGFIVVLIVLILLAVIIVLLSKVIQAVEGSAKKVVKTESNAKEKINKSNTSPTPVAVPAQQTDSLTLYKTDYKTAASIMAIVSHETGIPLNRLAFSSIKLDDSLELYKTDDKTAASIMAIVSHQSGIPLDRLVFKSIKLIEK